MPQSCPIAKEGTILFQELRPFAEDLNIKKFSFFDTDR